MSKKEFEDIFVFSLSPLISIPLIFKGLYEKRDLSIYLLSMLLGIISFLYIPLETNDKLTYYVLYNDFATSNWSQFLLYLSENPDFSFYVFIYFFAKLNIPLDYFFLICTTFTTFVFFNFFLKFNLKNNVSKRNYFLFIIGIICAISITSLFSGVRFYLAISFVLISFLKIFYQKKNFQGFLVLLFAISIHFSCLLYAIVFILLKLFQTKNGFIKSIFIFSFSFLLIPKEFFLSQLPALSSYETLQSKGQAYFSESDSINHLVGNDNNQILNFASGIWIYLAILYIFLTFKRSNLLRSFLLVTISIANLFYMFPVVYERYLILIQFLFIISLYVDYAGNRISFKAIIFFIGIYFIGFSLNIYGMRNQFIYSLIDMNSITLITIFMKERLTEFNFIK